MALQPIGFRAVQLLKDQVLGIGSYGKVCKAQCDELLCAAKLIHETLFDPTAEQLVAPQREHRLPMRRFEQECQFLSTMRHPNIVQYLGIYQDPDTGLPALLMELMDDSLTHFVESSTQPIPYHIAIDICHDIALALSFLHSNDIVHRDLSSNNVLLIGNVRAKVTDFGMARLGELNPRATHLTFTMCPGTDVYMPPEAVQEKPVYTEKIDCFSFGVITLQMLTRKFPKPGDRRRRIQITQPGIPSGMAEVLIAETERRQNHISEVDPNHPLLQVTLDCLKDGAIERPSAQQLCGRVAALKESPGYEESVRTTEYSERAEREEELRSLTQQHTLQVQGLQQIILSQISRLEEKDQILRQKDGTIAMSQRLVRQRQEEIDRLNQEKARKEQENEQLRRENNHVSERLAESERVVAQCQGRITELEQLMLATETSHDSKQQNSQRIDRIRMTWREEGKAPCKLSYNYNTAANSTTLYIRIMNTIYSYNASTFWSQLPDTPTWECPSVIITDLLTLIGGYFGGTTSNQLFSLTGEGSGRRWTEVFPAMPTKRAGSTALCTGTDLIVAGGIANGTTNIVEIMNISTLQWSTATDLPLPLYHAPGAVCGDHIFILSLLGSSTSMCTCSVSALLQSVWSRPTADVWNRVTAPPVTKTTCVSTHGRLLAIGGRLASGMSTADVYMYDSTADSWEVISRMPTPRSQCAAAVLHNCQLVVVGGKTTDLDRTDLIEIANLEHE